MALSRQEIERQLAQNRGDILDIYAMLTRLQTTVDGHTATLAEHGATLAEHGATLGEHTGLLHEILRRLPEPPAA